MEYLDLICTCLLDYGTMLFLIASLLCWELKKRSHFPSRYAVSIFLYIGLVHSRYSISILLGFERFGQWPVFMIGDYANFSFVIIFLLETLALWCCFRERFTVILFLSASAYVIQHLCFSIWTFIQLLFELTDEVYRSAPLLILRAMTDAAVIAAIVFFLRKKKGVAVYPKSLVAVSFSTVAVFIVAIVNIVVVNANYSNPATAFYAILSCILLLIIIILFMDQSEAERRQKIMDNILRERDLQYKLSKDAVEIINIRCHDLKKQINEIQKQAPKSDQAEICAEIDHAIKVFGAVHDTGNEALDVILNEKSLACMNGGINLSCSISDVDALAFMNTLDIYAVFGNLLDNAIEAVQQETETHRNIKLNIKQNGRMLFVCAENDCSHDLSFKNGFPITTKPEKESHGFGLQSVRYVLEKYGGSIFCACEDGVFAARACIPIPQ